jgi:hypothetical protein
MLKSKTYVVSWDEVLDNTIQIEKELVAGEFDYQIINKSRLRTESPNWIKAKDTRYYGHFFTALEDFMSSPQHSIFIFNAGDARWPEISAYTKRLEQLFNDNPNAGVISPNQTNDPFTGSGSFIAKSEIVPGLAISTMTNGIYVALTREIAEIMYRYIKRALSKNVDLYKMTSGWGLDYAYCGVAVYLNKAVYKDTSLTMIHPTGSGYNYTIADGEFRLVIKSFLEFWEAEGRNPNTLQEIFNFFINKVEKKNTFQLSVEDLYLNAKSKLTF